jgi:four helix bundle protein
MQDFRNLVVWNKAHILTLTLYKTTESFPKSETFGLAATLRRGTASVAMKIAEACGQDVSFEFQHRVQQARAIGVGVEYQLLLARDLQFIEPSAYDALQHQLIEVRKMLSGLMKQASL